METKILKTLSWAALLFGVAAGSSEAQTITSFNPPTVVAGGPQFSLTIYGSGFAGTNVLSWIDPGGTTINSIPFTASSGDTQVTVTIPAARIFSAGNATVAVCTGSTSNCGPSMAFPVGLQLTSLQPSSVLAGANQPVTVLVNAVGGLEAIGQYYWNGTTILTQTGSPTATQAQIQIPASLVNPVGQGTITAVFGGQTSNGLTFSALAPVTTSIQPTGVTAGSAAFTMTINGSNFGSAATSNPVVIFNLGESTTSYLPTTNNGSVITVTIPASAVTDAGTATIAVQNYPEAQGPTSNFQNFNIYNLPVVTSVSPNAVNYGASTPITVTGSFNAGDQIVFNGTTLPTTGNATQLQATVPYTLENLGQATVQAINPANSVSATSATLNVIPVISSLSPNTAQAGSAALPLTVNVGGGLTAGAPITITFNGTALTGTFVNSLRATTTVPANLLVTPAQVPVTISTLGVTSAPATFTITGATPQISGITPPSTTVGSAPSLLVAGTNFNSSSVVVFTFNSSSMDLATSLGPGTNLTAVVPSSFTGTPGTATITVQNGVSGPVSNGVAFPIYIVPVVTGVSPSTTPYGTATPLTVTGTFNAGDQIVFNGTTLPTTGTTTQLQATVLAAEFTTLGPNVVRVTNPANTTSTTSGTVNVIPVITTLNPSSVVAGSGAFTLTVNVTGGFGSAPITVNFNGTSLTGMLATLNQVSAQVPANLVLTQAIVPVTVSTMGATSAPANFTIGGQPQITSVNPPSTPVGSSPTLIVSGNNFITGSVVVFTANSQSTDLATTPGQNGTLFAVLPSSLTTTATLGGLAVRNGINGPVSLTFPFAITSGGPTISSVTPNQANVGAQDTPVVIDGTNFKQDSPPYVGSRVLFTPPNSTTPVQLTPTSTSLKGVISVVIPQADLAVGGQATIAVTNVTDGTTSNALPFSIIAIPTITSLFPNPTAVGDVTALDVFGTNFLDTDTILVGAPGCVTLSCLTPLHTTFNSSTNISGSLLAGTIPSQGIYNVYVEDTFGNMSNVSLLTVGIEIISLNPTSVLQNVTPIPTLVVTSDGGFDSTSVVYFNNQPLPTVLDSPTQVHATLTAADVAAAGTFPVTVQAGSFPASNTLNFTVLPAGRINSITPTSAFVGSAAIPLQVTGVNFASGDTIQFGGSALTTTFVNAQTLTATVPAALLTNAGSFPVTVLDTSNTVSNAINFQVGLEITGLTPPSVNAGGPAFNLTATLTGGVTSNTVLYYAGTQLATVSSTATSVTALVPASLIASVGTPPVYAMDGTNQSNTVNHLVLGPLTLISISPAFVDAGSSAFQLNLTGTGFDSSTAVLINGAPIATVFNTATSLSALIPAGLITTPGTAQVSVLNDAQQMSNALPLAILAPLSLTSLNPVLTPAGSPQFVLAVNGVGFDPTDTVTWAANGVVVNLTTTFASATQLMAIVPAALVAQVGAAAVGVTDARGRVSANTLPFGVVTPLTETSLNPSSALVGTAVNMTITGTGFLGAAPLILPIQSQVQVLFGTVSIPVTPVSDTQINVTIPANVNATPGVVAVAVQAADGLVSNSLPFNAFTNPVITGINPGAVSIGQGGLPLTVSGLYFLSGAVVEVNGSALATAFVSSTQLTAALPAFNATGTETIVVVNPGGLASNSVTLTVSASRRIGPTLSTISPSSVAPGGPGFTLTATGSGFQSGAVIAFGGVTLATTFVDTSHLTAGVPSSLVSQSGTIAVAVINADGTPSNSLAFYVLSAPVISSLTPTSISAGAPAFTLNLTGLGFETGATVSFGGNPLVATVTSSMQLSVTVPAALVAIPAQIPVILDNPDGTMSLPVPFLVNAFSLTSINPSTATAGGPSFAMTLTGTGFLSGATASLNGSALATTFVNATTLTVTVPASAIATAGTAQVTVKNPDGAVGGPVTLTIANGLTLISINPTTIPQNSPATQITATGTGFAQGATILFNGVAIATTFGSTTGLTGTIPASMLTQTGPVPVTVTNPNGNATNAVTFTVGPPLPPPVISSVSPSTAVAGAAATTITLTGTGFVQGSAVQLAGAAAATTFVSGTQLKAVLTAAQLAQAGVFTIQVVNPDASQSNTVNFTVSTPLSISSLSPAAVSQGAGNTPVTIAGAGFVSGATVLIGTTPLTANVSSSTVLSVTIPSSEFAQTGQLSVTVKNPDGTVSNALVLNVVPLPTITLTATLVPAGTNQVTIALDSPSPSNLTGTLEMSFTANASNTPAGYIDPAAQFASGGTSITFTIPAGAKTATLPGNGTFSPGTVAGTLTLTLTALMSGGDNVLPNPAPSASFTLAQSAPSITPGTVTIINQSATGFTVEMTGFSTTREVQSATVVFSSSQTISSGATVTVNVSSAFAAYFASVAGLANGGTFKLDIPFTIAGGNSSIVTGVSVTLTNSAGTSQAVSGGS